MKTYKIGEIVASEENTTVCPKCNDTGWYPYDHNHSSICDQCCSHDEGYFELIEHYGEKNGMWCCINGCGHLLTKEAYEKT